MLRLTKTMRIGSFHRRRDVFDGILRLVILAMLVVPLAAWSAQKLMAEPAPDFALKSFAGDNLRLSEYRSEVVLVNFWADWCGRCRPQLTVIDALYAEQRAHGFKVLSINIDEDSTKARKTVADLRLQFPVLSDHQKHVSRLYDLETTPVMVLIDAHGIVRNVHKGYESGDEQVYRSELAALLVERCGRNRCSDD